MRITTNNMNILYLLGFIAWFVLGFGYAFGIKPIRFMAAAMAFLLGLHSLNSLLTN